MVSADKRLIVALDFHTMAKVSQMVHVLGDAVNYYKVGMELFFSVGPEVIKYLREKDKMVFLDLKLHDIPNTVAKSAAALTKLGATMLNVHAPGGHQMMKAAGEAVAKAADDLGVAKPKLLAVTVLTSISSNDWQKMGHNNNVHEQAVEFAKLAKDAGLDGVVASGQEASIIRNACGADFDIVTPGIRLKGADTDDQSRIVTPSEALNFGASHLVVGRPITTAADPRAVAEKILLEMNEI